MTLINSNKISLVKDTINKEDIDKLIEWLKTNPRLTKGELTKQFEKKWANWLGRKYSIFLNSGSSANLAMLYSLLLSNRLKNKNIIVPAVSWVTTVTPLIHLGFNPILCECDKDTLGVDVDHLNKLVKEYDASALIIVHVLGFPNKMDEILEICNDNNIILLEDSCESIGSTYNNIKTGNFGLMSTFSTYYGHHFSSIEGGIVSTDDEEIYNILLSIRSHGWDRDYDLNKQQDMRKQYNVSDFRALYTFYYPGFNLRSTDLQAFLALEQLEKLDGFIQKRNINYKIYHKEIKNDYWKIKELDNTFISNFSYPIITDKLNVLVDELTKNNVEIRPLVCGSISRQPFWENIYGKSKMDFADIVHDFGMYVPNNHDLTEDEIYFICDIINKFLK
jgi:CDP-6-deoxy-D-xylo-4-hexulose-3-dehydrase